MFEERGVIDGDFDVQRDTRLYGTVNGDVTVKRGRTLVLHGTVKGSLFVEETSSVHIYGTVYGDVIGRGSALRVWSTGVIRGIVDRGSATRIEAGAKVHALAASDKLPSQLPDSDALEGFRVLLAEDDDQTRDAIVNLLRSCRALPIAASHGVEAFEVFRRERPDAVVSDLWMPQEDGYHFIERVRGLPHEEGRLTPAIAMTASTSDPQAKALAAGFHVHLEKPFDPAKLVEILISFRAASDESAQSESKSEGRFALTQPREGWLLVSLGDHVRLVDVHGAVKRLGEHLRKQPEPATVVVDARRVTGADAAAGSLAERLLWPHRGRIGRLYVVSRERVVHLVATASCAVLGVRSSMAMEPPAEVARSADEAALSRH
jgi:CheY-like chemotaxis protein